MSEPSTVAVITARGGSKGLPRKNLKVLAGKPLVVWSIEAALQARRIQAVVVSTDDDEIARVSEAAGATIVRRPPELSGDLALSEDAVRHALETTRAHDMGHTHVTLLQPTSPLRRAHHIDEMIDAAIAGVYVSAVAVTQPEAHPLKMLVIRDGQLEPVGEWKHLMSPRQQLPRAVRQNGAIYWLPVDTFLAKNTFFVPPIYAYEMPRELSIDIDHPEDLAACEKLLLT